MRSKNLMGQQNILLRVKRSNNSRLFVSCCSYFNRAPKGFGGFYDLWKETVPALTYEQQKANYQRAMQKPHQGTIKIAYVLIGHYQPEEISLAVDSEKIVLHGQHQCEQEDGFGKSEFMRIFTLPPGVDPTTVRSRINPDNGVLVIEGTKQSEDKANDGEFEAKLDFSGFRPEEIKLHLRGNTLTVTGIHVCERHQSGNTYSRFIVLPEDVDPGSVMSCLSGEGLLTIKASRDSAMLSGDSSGDVTITRETNEEPKEKTTSADA